MTKKLRTQNFWKNQFTSVAFLSILAANAHAGFQYAGNNGRDLLIGFRKAGGSYELIVNAGSVSNFYNLPIGTQIVITNVTTNQLSAAFADLNDVSWSAGADVRASDDANYPFNTLWVARARTSLGTQSTPWIRAGTLSQGTTAGKISGLGDSMASYGNNNPTGTNNTSYGVVVPANQATYSYSYYMGQGGAWGNPSTFQGNVECTTSSTFDTDGQPVRADLYQMIPTSVANQNAAYLGYFEFNPNGVMTYKSGPSSSSLTGPTIVSITRSNTTSTITFTTGGSGQYSLRYTNTAGLTAPISTWATSGSPVTGDGSNHSLDDTTSDAARVYAVSATP